MAWTDKHSTLQKRCEDEICILLTLLQKEPTKSQTLKKHTKKLQKETRPFDCITKRTQSFNS